VRRWSDRVWIAEAPLRFYGELLERGAYSWALGKRGES
jgi:hypothetical protein